MLNLPNSIQQNISFILEKTAVVNDIMVRRFPGTELIELVETASMEISLLSLVAADALDRMHETETILIRGDLSFRLRQVAFHCLDVQETEDADEMRYHLSAAYGQCEKLADLIKLPMPELHGETGLVPAELSIEKLDVLLRSRAFGDPDSELLRAEIRTLRELLASLVMEREQLRTNVLPQIESKYMRQLGGLEADIYRAEYELRTLKERILLIQSRLNRGQVIDEEEIDASILRSVQEFWEKYKEFSRRAEESQDYEKKRNSTDAEGSIEQKCRSLYRKLMKQLHPDIHLDLGEREKELFNRANTAYEERDLRVLQEIDAMLGGDDEFISELLDELQKEKERILEMIRNVRAEIRSMKEQYPYNKKKILEDPELLKAERGRMSKQLAGLEEMIRFYREREERLKEQNE